jgi:alpha-tubulin suppressor-like RCC1 family protein
MRLMRTSRLCPTLLLMSFGCDGELPIPARDWTDDWWGHGHSHPPHASPDGGQEADASALPCPAETIDHDADPATPCVSARFTYSAVALAPSTSCALRAGSGIVSCWGLNTSEEAVPPADVPFAKISAGSAHFCGIRRDSREVVCWGNNQDGKSAPPSGVRFIDVSAGSDHTCGVTESGRALCWGNDGFGQASPPGDISFEAVSVGAGHSCGIRADTKEAACWGCRDYDPSQPQAMCGGQPYRGQLHPPAGVPFASLSSSSIDVCGIRADNAEAVCWGANSVPPEGIAFSKLTNGGNYKCGLIASSHEALCWGSGATPYPPPSGASFADLGTTNLHTCGVLEASGEVHCWGNNERGQAMPPDDLAYLSLDADDFETCGIDADTGELRCWLTGYSLENARRCELDADAGTLRCWQSDLDYSSGRTAPAPNGYPFSTVSTGATFSCGVRPCGAATCWGANTFGQLYVPANLLFSSVSAGEAHACGVRADTQQAVCWGRNNVRQAAAPEGLAFAQLSCGSTYTCGLRADTREAVCWGDDKSGSANPPSGVAFSSIASSVWNTCAVRADTGQATCWGSNEYGESDPPAGAVLSGVTLGLAHGCGLLATEHEATCWGGLLGAGRQVAPRGVRFSKLSAASLHTCGVREGDGQVVCWGRQARNIWRCDGGADGGLGTDCRVSEPALVRTDAGSGSDAGADPNRPDAGGGCERNNGQYPGGVGSGADDWFVCGADSFPAIERVCSSSDQCSAVEHQVDCFGNIRIAGIRTDAIDAFNAAESACRASYPQCPGTPYPPRADDGSIRRALSVPGASCDNGRCKSVLYESRVTCSDRGLSCPLGYVCCQQCSNNLGSETCENICALPCDGQSGACRPDGCAGDPWS